MTYKIVPRATRSSCGYDFFDERDGRAGIPFLHIRQDMEYLRDPDNPALRETELGGPSFHWGHEGFTMFTNALVRARDLALQFRQVYLWYLLMEAKDDDLRQTVTSQLLGPSESFVRAVCRDQGVEGRLIEISCGRQFTAPLRTE